MAREARQAKTIQELTAENKKLKRRVSRLEKRMEHYHGHVVDDDDDAPPAPRPPVVEVPVCSGCGSSKLKSAELNGYTLIVCTECNHREKKDVRTDHAG